MKTCTKCGRIQPREQFGVDRRRRDGLNGWCKACARDASQRYRSAHPEKARAAEKAWRDRNPVKVREQTRKSVLRRYGFTRADFHALFENQGGGCAICGARSGARALHIDHLHFDGFNALAAKEDPELLERAASYLEAFEARMRVGT